MKEHLIYRVKELAYKIKRLVNFKGKILWNTSKKDGALKKLLDSNYLFNKGWKPQKSLDERLKEL